LARNAQSRSRRARVFASVVAAAARHGRASSGNSGGGKGPDFERAFEVGEVDKREFASGRSLSFSSAGLNHIRRNLDE
jgi:hypothetical protein